MNRDDLPVPAPCEASWDAMRGTQTRRFCARCQKNVHNLSALTEGEAAALLAGTSTSPCVRYRYDREGRVMFRAGPSGSTSGRATVRLTLAGAAMWSACAAEVDDPDAAVADGGLVDGDAEVGWGESTTAGDGFAGESGSVGPRTPTSAFAIAPPIAIEYRPTAPMPTTPTGGAHDDATPRHVEDTRQPREHGSRWRYAVAGQLDLSTRERLGIQGKVVLGEPVRQPK